MSDLPKGFIEQYKKQQAEELTREYMVKFGQKASTNPFNEFAEFILKQDSRLGINETAQRAHEDAKSLGWYDEGKTKSDLETLAMVVTEVCECIDELRKPNPRPRYFLANEPNLVYNSDNIAKLKPEGYGVEIADAVIRLLDFAAYKGLDLEALIDEKLKYNLTRGHRHGNKAF